MATDLPIVTSSATTAEGALRDVWRAVIAASDASSPPVSVLLLPGVQWLKRWERMEALFSHLRSCRGCSRFLGSTVRLQALHPSYSSSPDESDIEVERKRAPVPAFTLSRRVGPSTLRPTGVDDDDEDDKDYVEEDESTRKAREVLERQFLAASTAGAAPPPPPPPLPPNVVIRDSVATASEPIGILKETMEWFASYFERVNRLFGHKQRRIVVQADCAEQVFATFWAEAARLYGDDDDADDAADSPFEVLQEPEEPLSSLLVVAGEAAGVDSYRAIRQSLALAFALLGLADSFTMSAFHPRDTYELRTDDDGIRYWEVSLPHPLMHIVKRKPVR